MKHCLYVCTSCRMPGEPREPAHGRAGSRLYASLAAGWGTRLEAAGIALVPYPCLSVCPRPCGVALRAPGKFTYVFGDMAAGLTEETLFACAALYRRKADGFMPREDRPEALRASILARVPPLLDP